MTYITSYFDYFLTSSLVTYGTIFNSSNNYVYILSHKSNLFYFFYYNLTYLPYSPFHSRHISIIYTTLHHQILHHICCFVIL